MYCERYRIAEKVFEIRSQYALGRKTGEDYRTEAPADYVLELTQAHIDRERQWLAAGSGAEAAARWPDAWLEEMAMHRMVSETLIECGAFLMHGSCIAVDGVGYLFTAPSGTGKSTHARLWRELLGERAVMVNDDKPMIRIGETAAIAYGSPWNGKEGLGDNISVPLRAICFLSQAKENRIEEISGLEAYGPLMQQIYRPRDPLLVQKTLTLADKLLERVRLYRLGCNMDPAAAALSYGVMSGAEDCNG
ncbi:MAG: hypothetical protein K6F56_08050 [Oscillospiraceae bacterium]|nr:hypothetical protein [Oscillospiraceae bacterium]